MSSNKRELCFFTNSYPYGKGETFIENELNFIAPYFDTIYLFHRVKSEECRAIPDNVKLIYIEPPYSISRKTIFSKNIALMLSFIIQESFFSRQKRLFRKNIKYNIVHFINCLYYSKEIESKLDKEVLKRAYFYSYWFFDWNLSLSVLKKRKRINHNITRAHGFDLYENNGKPNYLPLRKFCLRNTDKVFVISKTGQSYLKSIYPKYSNRIAYSYLGTKDYGTNPLPNDTEIHIVSCSNVNEVKRVHLIVEILKSFNKEITWTHIGDGLLLDDIKQKSKKLPNNITVNFAGRLSQKEIFTFYKETPIDVFINTSISEGLPVSIMEAISFGIPIIATDVGGTAEIVNSKTGILLDIEFVSEIAADAVLKFKSKENLIQFRKQVKEFWEHNFFADINYSLFVNHFS